jgi:asparagine synthase (glutamine-hydrolysing)
MFPVAYWFQNQLSAFLTGFWKDARIVEEGIVQQAAILRLVDDHRRGLVDHHVRLWMLLNVELWYRMYIDRTESLSLSEDLQRRVAAAA